MNVTDLWEYLVVQRTMFSDKFVGIISRDNKFYSLEIKNGGIWIHYPSWASTINNAFDLQVLKYPVRLHLEDLPPYECLMDLYNATKTEERLGQWFYNRYAVVVLQGTCASRLYEETNKGIAYAMIYEEYYQV